MKLTISDHAKLRIKERNISITHIAQAMLKGTIEGRARVLNLGQTTVYVILDLDHTGKVVVVSAYYRGRLDNGK